MTREQLRKRLQDTVSRYARTIADSNGVPFTLLEELTRIAEEHTAEAVSQAAEAPFTLGVPVVACETVEPAGEPFAPVAFSGTDTIRQEAAEAADKLPRPRRSTRRSTDH